MSNKTMLLILLCSFSFLQMDCKDDPPVVPPVTHPIIEWTIDTIKNPFTGQLYIQSIWGSSSDNIFACGHNSAGAAVLWHYNGNTWSDIKLNPSQGGTISGNLSLSRINGYNAQNIIAVGRRNDDRFIPPMSNVLIQFNGFQWSEVNIPVGRGGMLTDVILFSHLRKYAVSSGGEIYNYEGDTWERRLIDSTVSLFSIGGDIVKGMMVGFNYSPPASSYVLYTNSGTNEWIEAERITESENISNPRFGFNFYTSGNGKYYAAGQGIFLFQNDIWTKQFDDGNYYSSITGTSSDNIYAIGPSRRIIHWNGKDWAAVTLPSGIDASISITSIWVSENEVIISGVGNPENQSLILRGYFQ